MSTRILTTWNWKADPEAPLRWPDPERRVVLVEPDLWAPPVMLPHVNAASTIHVLERRGAIVVEPTRYPLELGFPGSIAPSPGIVPALLARTQVELDAGIADLLAVPAAHRALIVEPLEASSLQVDLRSTRPRGVLGCPRCHGFPQVCAAGHDQDGFPREATCSTCDGSGLAISWVIVRGGAEPMHPAWVCALRDQCAAADVPFAFLGWGDWLPICDCNDEDLDGAIWSALVPDGTKRDDRYSIVAGTPQLAVTVDGLVPKEEPPPGSWWFGKVGAARSGRSLDGREHLDSPWGPLEVP